ncbi:MAG: DUF3473 domain-containing protein [Thermodesulfovibrionales bacterium]|nr:DUF3473 domain-containing protein [Thermodesulfovibrionales bacterium]
MINALTVDVEDYFMVSAFAHCIKFEEWNNFECRVDRNVYKILEVLAKFSVRATFFMLGWVAERYPALVRDIYESGHEIASHGYNHKLIYDLSPDEFRRDVQISKRILEDIIGIRIAGYRAPSYSISKKTLWALDILVEEGYVYDSSIFPIHHDVYGIPEAKRFPHIIKTEAGSIMEYPPSTLRFLGLNIPVAGGGYLRLLPVEFIKYAIKRLNEKEKSMAILYIHPWEIDTEQPRLRAGLRSSFRHYFNIRKTLSKIESILKDFKFESIGFFYFNEHKEN